MKLHDVIRHRLAKESRRAYRAGRARTGWTKYTHVSGSVAPERLERQRQRGLELPVRRRQVWVTPDGTATRTRRPDSVRQLVER